MNSLGSSPNWKKSRERRFRHRHFRHLHLQLQLPVQLLVSSIHKSPSSELYARLSPSGPTRSPFSDITHLSLPAPPCSSLFPLLPLLPLFPLFRLLKRLHQLPLHVAALKRKRSRFQDGC